MDWNVHKNVEGRHAFLSPSQYSWIRKSDSELKDAKLNSYATTIGTLVHNYAETCIRFKEELCDSDIRMVRLDLLRNGIPAEAIDIQFIFPTLMRYVNDSIAFGMDPEVVLYYSDNCFGTTDAIQFRRKHLRIHDLKTGLSPAKIDQLMIYAALFYLEYGYKPESIHTELRIYQAGDILLCEPSAAEVREVMGAIVNADRVLSEMFPKSES